MSSAPTSTASRPFLAAQLVLAVAALAVAVWAVVPYAPLMVFFAETGPIERGTAALYFLSAVGILFVAVPGLRWPLRLALCVALLAFGARELDLHKTWTGVSALKVSFYLGAAPLQQKLGGLAVVLPVAASFAYLALSHGGAVLRGLRRRHPVALTAAVFLVTIVLSKLIDRSENVLLEDYGYRFEEWMSGLRAALEESLELCLPLLVWVGVLQQRVRSAGPLTRK
ncbi:hypothetical protein OOT46_17345 [Aquabacterium sp. A7-Y]|uniref:hypothetical protein n=1 Tax=Aquabacterium sp. A7-Y TaxID=1349605 RepID=UPI00223C9B45|nr:hypothetical protein [Aquabacterium sp. A7-Y]MCW7539612.1 hypothetical protein [Aquabacterium sp. A7-Y]